LKPIAEFLPTPAQVLAVGDAWDKITPEARAAILMLTGFAWVGSSGRWIEIPASARLGIAHGFYFFRDFINQVLP
jgi:hypothetical protein